MKLVHKTFICRQIRHKQAGLTLLEVLIAVLVLALGMAGLATLYLFSLASVHSGLLSSLASTIALDFEERLWVETGAAGDGTCPDPIDVSKLLEADWDGSRHGGFLSLPNLRLEPGAIIPSARFQQVPITITWTEDRFRSDDSVNQEEENAGATPAQETFDYVARVYCTPAAPGT